MPNYIIWRIISKPRFTIRSCGKSDYEMTFQAKINRALSFSGRDSKAIKSQLLKMLKDDKNIEYFDQIYYALAEISFKNNAEELGKEQLQKSINSTNNISQKLNL